VPQTFFTVVNNTAVAILQYCNLQVLSNICGQGWEYTTVVEYSKGRAGDNLKVVWAEFSTLSQAVLLSVQWHVLYKHARV
jgi:hypothetical protein